MFLPRYVVNQNGIPCVESSSVVVNGTTDVRYTFQASALLRRFRGLMILKLAAIPTGTATTLPITAVINGNPVPVTNSNGDAVTVADIQGEGVYIAYACAWDNELRLLTGLI